MLMDMNGKDFLAELASDSPAPGGGSVAALAGALGAALVEMVARLTIGKDPADQQEMEQVRREAAALQHLLAEDVDRDTQAFNQVMASFKLPKLTGDDKNIRRAAIQAATKEATLLPLAVAADCLAALQLASTVISKGNPNALSDAGVAALMAHAGVQGAGFNVLINLAAIEDPVFKGETLEEIDLILARAKALADQALAEIRQSLSGEK